MGIIFVCCRSFSTVGLPPKEHIRLERDRFYQGQLLFCARITPRAVGTAWCSPNHSRQCGLLKLSSAVHQSPSHLLPLRHNP
jgi:hypothetical protein